MKWHGMNVERRIARLEKAMRLRHPMHSPDHETAVFVGGAFNGRTWSVKRDQKAIRFVWGDFCDQHATYELYRHGDEPTIGVLIPC